MDEYQSLALGKIPVPESISELVDLVFDSSREAVYMWRGQANADWRIDSSAYRRYLWDKGKPPSSKSLAFYEDHLLRKARHKGFDFVAGRCLSDLEMLARLQHHGAATRLVDFTRSALVATFFACEQLAEKTGVLIGFHTNYLVGHEGDKDERPYEEIAQELERLDSPATWQPTGVSLRIAAQGSQFLYSRISEDDRGSLQIPDKKDALLAVGISPVMKAQLLVFLKGTCDIHRLSLFPDLDGFSQGHGTGIPIFENERW